MDSDGGQEKEKQPLEEQRIANMSLKIKEKLQSVMDYINSGAVPNTLGTLMASAAATYDSPWAIGAHLGAALLNYTIGFLKYLEHKKIRAALEKHGWDERIIKPKSYTFCQRHSALLAAKRTGYEKEVRELFKREGHKWWHFLPKVHRMIKED